MLSFSLVISGCQSIFVLLEGEENVTDGNCRCYINVRTEPSDRGRLLKLNSIVYLIKMMMSHLVMKTLINVFLSLLLLIQAGLRTSTGKRKKKIPDIFPVHSFPWWILKVDVLMRSMIKYIVKKYIYLWWSKLSRIHKFNSLYTSSCALWFTIATTSTN